MASEQSAVAPAKAAARSAGLTYVSDLDPGIGRRRSGTGFSYRLPDGTPLNDADTTERIRSLVIPPAWTDVWICTKASGHIQATGRDARGRKQYKYHPQWREVRDLDKYEHMLEFARLLPRLRAKVGDDLSKRGTPREKVLATVVSLLDKALVRVGNDAYAKANGSYGLTTLRVRHLAVNGAELRFHFKGKSGKVRRLKVQDRRIARVVRSIQDLPGQNLFQYVDDEGNVRTVDSSDVNSYLREVTGREVTSKDFRTWAGTVLAFLALSALEPAASKAEAKRNVRRAIQTVAERLGNTPAVCRKCYVHPRIIADYLKGALPPFPVGENADAYSLLAEAEPAVLAILRRRLPKKRVRASKDRARAAAA